MFYQKTILLHHLLLFQHLCLIINGSMKDEWFVESYEELMVKIRLLNKPCEHIVP